VGRIERSTDNALAVRSEKGREIAIRPRLWQVPGGENLWDRRQRTMRAYKIVWICVGLPALIACGGGGGGKSHECGRYCEVGCAKSAFCGIIPNTDAQVKACRSSCVDAIERGQDANGVSDAAQEGGCDLLIPIVQSQSCREFIDFLASFLRTSRTEPSGDVDGFEVGESIAECAGSGF
jgi:hypothetical protein